MPVKMTVVAENKVPLGKGLIGEHGFGVFLETEAGKVLWDTGQGFCIPHNLKPLGINLTGLKAIALSHGHYDHTGGLMAALTASGGAPVYCHPACFENKRVSRELFGKKIELYIGMPDSRADLEKAGADFREIEDTAEIVPGVHFFTGIPMEDDFEKIESGFFVQEGDKRRDDLIVDDACLAVVTDQGVSVILGCAHRGLINTLRHVKGRLGNDRFHSVWGGTHMVDRSPEEVERTIEALRELDVGLIATAHCTGFANEARLASALPERFTFATVGARAEL
ncbi:MAG: MBL fold metallo-hydrolase [bacterium]